MALVGRIGRTSYPKAFSRTNLKFWKTAKGAGLDPLLLMLGWWVLTSFGFNQSGKPGWNTTTAFGNGALFGEPQISTDP